MVAGQDLLGEQILQFFRGSLYPSLSFEPSVFGSSGFVWEVYVNWYLRGRICAFCIGKDGAGLWWGGGHNTVRGRVTCQ